MSADGSGMATAALDDEQAGAPAPDQDLCTLHLLPGDPVNALLPSKSPPQAHWLSLAVDAAELAGAL